MAVIVLAAKTEADTFAQEISSRSQTAINVKFCQKIVHQRFSMVLVWLRDFNRISHGLTAWAHVVQVAATEDATLQASASFQGPTRAGAVEPQMLLETYGNLCCWAHLVRSLTLLAL